MSDKTEIKVVEDEPKHTKKRWLIFLGIFLLVLLILAWFLLSTGTTLDGVKRFFRYFGRNDAQYGSLQFDTYGTCSYALTDDRFAVATQSGAFLFSEDGDVIGRVQGNFSAPALKSAGKYLLVYDIGGTRLTLLDSEGGSLFDKTAAGAIFDADVSSGGYVSVLYEGTESHAALEVYEKGGTLLYRRNSKSSYLNACAISADGANAVVTTLGQTDVSFTSGAQLLQTDREDIAAELSLGAQIIYDIAYLNDSTVCAIGENSLLFFGTDGTLRGEYATTGSETVAYRFGSYVALLSDPYEAGSFCRLTTLDANGDVIATVEIEETPLDLSLCGGYVAVLTEQSLYLYDRNLSLRGSRPNAGFLAARVRTDGTAFCISAGEAELYIP